MKPASDKAKTPAPAKTAGQPIFVYFPQVVTRTGPETFIVKPGPPVLWVSAQDIANETGRDRKTVYSWVANKTIPPEFVEPSGHRHFRFKAGVIPYLKQHFAFLKGLGEAPAIPKA